jgi:hypothetical protein
MIPWEETTSGDPQPTISLPAVNEEPLARLERWARYIATTGVLGGTGAVICFAVWSLLLFALGRPKPSPWLVGCGLALILSLVPLAIVMPTLERIVRARATQLFVIRWSPTHVRAAFVRESRALEIKVDEIDRFETWADHVTIVRTNGTRCLLPAIIEPEVRAKLVERLGQMLESARTDARIRIATLADYRGHEATLVENQAEAITARDPDKSEERK